MRRLLAVLVVLGLASSWARASSGRFTVHLQAGAGVIGTGQEPRFRVGWFGAILDSTTRQRWDGDFAVVSRMSYLRGLFAYRPFSWLACVASLDEGLPVGHLERHDVQMGGVFRHEFLAPRNAHGSRRALAHPRSRGTGLLAHRPDRALLGSDARVHVASGGCMVGPFWAAATGFSLPDSPSAPQRQSHYEAGTWGRP